MIFINENNRRKLSVLPLSIMLSLCGMSVSHAANIIADEAAPAGQQADTNGLSHNKYTKFDAPHFQDVVILNNNLIKESNGNPNLENTTAKIILNEVRSSHASQLAGKIRLSGQDAHVIIANPSGIYINSVGFNNNEWKVQAQGGNINIVLDTPIENNNGDISIIGKTKIKRLVM